MKFTTIFTIYNHITNQGEWQWRGEYFTIYSFSFIVREYSLYRWMTTSYDIYDVSLARSTITLRWAEESPSYTELRFHGQKCTLSPWRLAGLRYTSLYIQYRHSGPVWMGGVTIGPPIASSSVKTTRSYLSKITLQTVPETFNSASARNWLCITSDARGSNINIVIGLLQQASTKYSVSTQTACKSALTSITHSTMYMSENQHRQYCTNKDPQRDR